MSNPLSREPSLVLLVDDEESERNLMGQIIERQGPSVLRASTCAEARAIFFARDPDIDLLVADIALPDGNGFELAIEFRQRKMDLRVLFISGHVGAEVRRFYGPEILNFRFLAKPFTAGELVANVMAVLQEA